MRIVALGLLPWLLLAQPSNPLASRTKGSANAPVTVYEMSDFQCPYCRQHAHEAFPMIEREYIATGKVRWIFINFPLPIHKNAPPAAEFAMCAAKQSSFWPAHDLLFRYQNQWASLESPSRYFLGLADSLRLSRERLQTCLQNGESRKEIEDDAAGAMKAGANSTPTFYVEGGMLAGAWPPTIWRPILDSVYRAKTGKPSRP
ncbi:MAG: DsbA family protein [Gemmatimonadales bacterium]